MSVIHVPRTIEEACHMLAVPGSIACAGATNLYVDRYLGKETSADIVSLHKLDELKKITREDDGWHIGSLCTFDQLEQQFGNQGALDALARAASLVGGPQVRNRGTIGGNIISASPSADTVPVLMVLDAAIVLKSIQEERRIAITDFMTGVKKTAIHDDELMTEIIIPHCFGKSAFNKTGKRNALAIAVCNTAVFLDHSDGVITSCAIAIGSCAPTAVRVPEAEQYLIGKSLPVTDRERDEIFMKIRTAIHKAISPIDDVRATASYRRAVAVNTTWKLIQQLWEVK